MDWNKEKFDWPHHNLSNFVISDPHTWHIQDTEKIYRNKNKSPVLLFIHGAGASTHSWRLILDHLKKRFRVILIDLPGHGFTKLGKKNRSSLEFITEDLELLLIKLNLKPDLVIGHSAGSAVALNLALSKKINKSVWSPSVYTMEDFIQKYSKIKISNDVTDSIQLNYILYKIIIKYNKSDYKENFEDFFYWGQVMIKDFDDIELELVDESKVFKAVKNQKEIDNSFDYLNKENFERIKSFWNKFFPKMSLNQKKFNETIFNNVPKEDLKSFYKVMDL